MSDHILVYSWIIHLCIMHAHMARGSSATPKNVQHSCNGNIPCRECCLIGYSWIIYGHMVILQLSLGNDRMKE